MIPNEIVRFHATNARLISSAAGFGPTLHTGVDSSLPLESQNLIYNPTLGQYVDNSGYVDWTPPFSQFSTNRDRDWEYITPPASDGVVAFDFPPFDATTGGQGVVAAQLGVAGDVKLHSNPAYQRSARGGVRLKLKYGTTVIDDYFFPLNGSTLEIEVGRWARSDGFPAAFDSGLWGELHFSNVTSDPHTPLWSPYCWVSWVYCTVTT